MGQAAIYCRVPTELLNARVFSEPDEIPSKREAIASATAPNMPLCVIRIVAPLVLAGLERGAHHL